MGGGRGEGGVGLKTNYRRVCQASNQIIPGVITVLLSNGKTAKDKSVTHGVYCQR